MSNERSNREKILYQYFTMFKRARGQTKLLLFYSIIYQDLKNSVQVQDSVRVQDSVQEHKQSKYIESECCVCFEQFDENFTPLYPCGHYIHIDCVKKTNKLVCPLCREPVIIRDREFQRFLEGLENLRQKKSRILRDIDEKKQKKSSRNTLELERYFNEF